MSATKTKEKSLEVKRKILKYNTLKVLTWIATILAIIVAVGFEYVQYTNRVDIDAELRMTVICAGMLTIIASKFARVNIDETLKYLKSI